MASLEDAVLKESLARTLGEEGAYRALEAFRSQPSVSVRLNPFKPFDGPLPILDGASPVSWSPFGYVLPGRPVFTLDPLFHAGAYYVQDSSAMFVGHIFRKALARYASEGRTVRVLDLCAAPGGKTTDISASLRLACGDNFLLVANEIMRQRASVLSDNVSVWGDPRVVVTSCDPSAFARMAGCFDIIVADVPCSGEGMFRKDPRAVEEWSPETVSLCSSRQKRILADVWPALVEGGTLVYSTCTFEPGENDGNLEWAARGLGGGIVDPEDEFGLPKTRFGHLLVPGEVPGEGQWAGMLIKDGAARPSRADEPALKSLRPLRMGVRRGETKGKDFIPDPDWALSLDFDRSAYPVTPVDEPTALHFLHRDTIVLPDAPIGYNVITYRGLPLGFVKNLGRRCNNLHPQSRRIRMDIEL